MKTPLILLVLIATAAPTPRVVVTFRNASLNSEAVAPDNMEVVKQYGRRLVLRVTTEENITTVSEEWIQEALGGEAYVERVEADVLASSGRESEEESFRHGLDNTTSFSANQTATNFSTYIESSAMTMLSAVADTGLSQLPTSGWNLDKLEPYALHTESLRLLTNGRGTVMAIIDSGLAEAAMSLFHPAVGYDFVSSADYSNKPNQARNPDYTDPGDQGPACPTASWHGTKVASIAMAIAPGATLSIMRVLGQCGVGFSSDIADAIVWAAGGQINGLLPNPYPAAVISLSLAGKNQCPSYLQSAVNQARFLGATVIAAAGNAAQNVSLFFPANCIGVLAVGASTRQGTLATYSNRGAGLAFSAQGGDSLNPIPVLGIVNGQLKASFAVGTSFAVPHVAGTMALLMSTGTSPNSMAYTQLLECNKGEEFCGLILSMGMLHLPQEGLNIFTTQTNATNINSSLAFASEGCPGSTTYRWRVAYVSNNVILTAPTIGEIPIYSGFIQQAADIKTEEFHCNPGCYITKFTVCLGIHYIIVQCSDGSSSPKFGYRDYTERCSNANEIRTVESSTGFTGIRGITGGDVNGMDFYRAGGGSQLVGCTDCQDQTSILCGSHPDQRDRILTGVWVHYATGWTLKRFSLYCSVYTCPLNYYMTPINHVCNTCDRCGAGTYISGCGGTTEGSCIPCGADCGDLTYRTDCSGTNPGYCTYCGECPAGQSFVGCTGGTLSDTHSCNTCDAGKYSIGGRSRACTSCGAGKYNPNSGGGSEASCIACPAGKYNPNSGSSVECQACGPGKYNPNTASSTEAACQTCSAGTYQAGLGAGSIAACVACPAGKYTVGAGESTCLLCAAGTYGPSTNGVGPASCTACGAGKYSTTLGANMEAACTVCPAGKNNPSTGGWSVIISCTFCQPGTNAMSTGLSQCTPCAAGKYGITTGLSSACTDCGTGKYNAATGSSTTAACQNCVKGSYASSVGLNACQACAAGTYAGAEGLAVCTGCASGSFTASTGQSACQPCMEITNCAIASGSFCLADFGSKCMPCDSIYACVYDTNKCFSNGNPSCLCNPGFEMINGKCSGCLAGKYKANSGSGLCTLITTPVCAQGTYLQQGTAFSNSLCIACPPLPLNALQGASGCDWSCSAGFDNNAP